MCCCICNKPVTEHEKSDIPGLGSAHFDCHVMHEAYQKKIKTIELSSLTMHEIIDLKEVSVDNTKASNKIKEKSSN